MQSAGKTPVFEFTPFLYCQTEKENEWITSTHSPWSYTLRISVVTKRERDPIVFRLPAPKCGRSPVKLNFRSQHRAPGHCPAFSCFRGGHKSPHSDVRRARVDQREKCTR